MVKFRIQLPYLQERWYARASEWERRKLYLFCAYLGTDATEPPRIKLASKRAVCRRKRAFMPGRPAHAPIFGLRKKYQPEPRYQVYRRLRKQFSANMDI